MAWRPVPTGGKSVDKNSFVPKGGAGLSQRNPLLKSGSQNAPQTAPQKPQLTQLILAALREVIRGDEALRSREQDLNHFRLYWDERHSRWVGHIPAHEPGTYYRIELTQDAQGGAKLVLGNQTVPLKGTVSKTGYQYHPDETEESIRQAVLSAGRGLYQPTQNQKPDSKRENEPEKSAEYVIRLDVPNASSTGETKQGKNPQQVARKKAGLFGADMLPFVLLMMMLSNQNQNKSSSGQWPPWPPALYG